MGLGLFVSGAFLVVASSLVYENELLNVPTISFLAFFGALLGDQAGFYVGKWVGPYFHEFAFIRKRQKTMQRVQGMIETYGSYVIFVGRFIPAVRSIIPAMLGITGFNRLKFLLLDLLACCLWSAALSVIVLSIGIIF